GCPSLYAESAISETGNITVRNLQGAENRSLEPAAAIREAGEFKLRNLQIARNEVEEPAQSPRAVEAKPSDEYGDVTADEAGDTRASGAKPSDEYGDVTAAESGPAESSRQIADPIRPFNVAMYHFNDKLYFYAWKPVSTGYKYVLPEEVRGLVSSFYENLKAPGRIINNLLQGKPAEAGVEFASFLINSTVGVGGLRNCAQECFGLRGRYADFGQTLGKYGVGFGFYLVLPFLGPSSVRDGIGFAVDWTMRPQTYLSPDFFSYESVGLFVHEKINSTSFHIGEYEALKEASIDPYVAMRDIYVQYRTNLIEKP
ncbi:MAG: VacJ family lipoprotein, partial [Syntrophaceae bacterium]